MVLGEAQDVAGKYEALRASRLRMQPRSARRRRRDGFLEQRAEVTVQRAQANLDMRGGRRRDDDGVSFRLVDQPQRIGVAIGDAMALAHALQSGGVRVRHTDHDCVRPRDESGEMLAAECACAGDQHANGGRGPPASSGDLAQTGEATAMQQLPGFTRPGCRRANRMPSLL